MASVTGHHHSSVVANLTYKSELESDFDNGEFNCTNPRAYAAKFKTYNKGNTSYNMATPGEAIVKEIHQFLKKHAV